MDARRLVGRGVVDHLEQRLAPEGDGDAAVLRKRHHREAAAQVQEGTGPAAGALVQGVQHLQAGDDLPGRP